MSSSYDDASGHDMSVLFYTVLPDIIVLSFHLGQCLCPGNRKETLVFQGCPLVTYRTCRPVTRTRLRAINSAQLTGVRCGSHVHIREFRNFNSLLRRLSRPVSGLLASPVPWFALPFGSAVDGERRTW